MKHSLVSLLFLLSFLCLTNCSEDDMLMDTYYPTDFELSKVDDNPKRPILNRVVTDGLKVTLEFTNPSASKKPEGGFELMINGARTGEDITPQVYSDSKNLTMTFNMKQAGTYRFKVLARWNSPSYLGSAEIWAKVEEGSGSTPTTVAPADTPKRPVIYNIITDGSKVTIKFVNFAAPQKPEGGFELMVDGKRTGTDITPRVSSTQKDVSMSFNMSNPQDHCYQIYARWNNPSYLASAKFCPGESTAIAAPGSPSGDFPGLPELQLVKGYEFNDVGRNVTWEGDGLKMHHLGRQDGKMVSIDGVGAYHFRITATGVTNSYRQELIPRNLPSPYFKNGWEAIWGKEYVYEIRMKLSENYDIGGDYTSFFGGKNDYTVNRLGPFTIYTEGDHYWTRQYYAKNYTTNPRGEARVYNWDDAEGGKLTPNVDFNDYTKLGPGYPTVRNDKGKWVKWTFYVKWTYDDTGFVKVYKNGKLFHSYKGPIGFKDAQGPYIKFGLYNSWWGNKDIRGTDTQESFVDYLRVYVPK